MRRRVLLEAKLLAAVSGAAVACFHLLVGIPVEVVVPVAAAISSGVAGWIPMPGTDGLAGLCLRSLLVAAIAACAAYVSHVRAGLSWHADWTMLDLLIQPRVQFLWYYSAVLFSCSLAVLAGVAFVLPRHRGAPPNPALQPTPQSRRG